MEIFFESHLEERFVIINHDFCGHTNSKIEFKYETIDGNAGKLNVLSKTYHVFVLIQYLSLGRDYFDHICELVHS